MANTGLNINSLIDDCLVYIFDYLSLIDKLKVDAVCKKWQCLNELSWKNVRRLDTEEIEFTNSSLIIKVIKKCGKYVNDLRISIYEDSNYLEIFEEISKNCINITQLTIEECLENTDERLHYNDIHLGVLFKKNPKIYSITLKRLKINGYCFLGLNLDLITEVSIEYCLFETNNYSKFFSQFTNLKNFHLLSVNSDDSFWMNHSNGIISALNNGNCKNIQNIYLDIRNEVVESDKLLMLLSKQKNLLKLDFRCSSVKVNRHFFQNLSLVNIVDLKIDFDEDVAYFSKELKNLENLVCGVKNLSDRFLDNLSIKCENLKKISIQVQEKYSLTVVSENYLSRLQKLEIFKFYNYCNIKQLNSNFDCILKSLSHCQNLKFLLLVRSEFTDTGATHLSSLLNLTDLHFSVSEITELQLILILTQLRNLKTLGLYQCENIKSNLIFDLINKMKTVRRDEHILEIIFDRKNDFTFDCLPLLKI